MEVTTVTLTTREVYALVGMLRAVDHLASHEREHFLAAMEEVGLLDPRDAVETLRCALVM
jgi:hypothetical protein